jgi:hypothetical protein
MHRHSSLHLGKITVESTDSDPRFLEQNRSEARGQPALNINEKLELNKDLAWLPGEPLSFIRRAQLASYSSEPTVAILHERRGTPHPTPQADARHLIQQLK